MLAAALADSDLFGSGSHRDGARMHQRIVKNDIGTLEQARSTQRKQIGCARSGTDQIYGPCAHWRTVALAGAHTFARGHLSHGPKEFGTTVLWHLM
jgi:hypothetical protein